MSREFILQSGTHALNVGEGNSLGPAYNERGEVDKYGIYIKLQILPIVPQYLTLVRITNIKGEAGKHHKLNIRRDENGYLYTHKVPELESEAA